MVGPENKWRKRRLHGWVALVNLDEGDTTCPQVSSYDVIDPRSVSGIKMR